MSNIQFQQHFVFKYRKIILCVFILLSAFLVYHALRVEKSYKYLAVLPKDNEVAKKFELFRNTFTENSNVISIGLATDSFFKVQFYNQYRKLHKDLAKLSGVENTLSIVNASLITNYIDSAKFILSKPLDTFFSSQADLDSQANKIKSLKFYKGNLFIQNNFLMLLYLSDKVAQSKEREIFVAELDKITQDFSVKNKQHIYISGLPYIRTQSATLISKELALLAISSSIFLLLSIWFFYKNYRDVFISLVVVIVGIMWSLGSIDLFHYKISLLTAIVPTIIVIIGIPNCIYFLNKYHFYYNETKDKSVAIYKMLNSMGKITLFCNLTMALGFFVFMFTKSSILYEFGFISGLNICCKFFISYSLIPLLLCYLPQPKKIKSYLTISNWVLFKVPAFYNFILKRKKIIFVASIVFIALSIYGIIKVKPLTFVLDEVPKNSTLRSDLKYFENTFKGIFTLEIIIDTKKKGSVFRDLNTLSKIDKMAQALEQRYNTKILSVIDGFKIIRQAYYLQDSNYYALPNDFDIGFIAPYLKKVNTKQKKGMAEMLNSFVDTTKQKLRLSLRVADIGSEEIKYILDSVHSIVPKYLDTSKINYTITGVTETFLEGNVFIIKGLFESIIWSVVLISLCLVYLFKSLRIILVSLVPNIFPLFICYGIMGFGNVFLKPSTVIIFSIALGISADITIRYLVSFKKIYQQHRNESIQAINLLTLQETFSSILFTAISLILGFLIFIISDFESIKALGWLTSLTLFISTIYNLVLLPLLLNVFLKIKK